jgi:hypothetical protein
VKDVNPKKTNVVATNKTKILTFIFVPSFLKVVTYAAPQWLCIEFIGWPKLRYPGPHHNLGTTPVFLPLKEFFPKI